MDRSSSTHSHATVPSPTTSTPQTVHRDSLKYPSNYPGFSPPSKRGSVNLREETYTPSRSRPSTGNSHSSRLWHSPTMYGIPDDDGDADDRDISAHWEHRHTSHSLSGQSPSIADASTRSSLMDMASRDIPSNSARPGHANSTSSQNPSIGTTSRPSTTSSTEPRPSMPTSPNNSLLTPLGLDFLSSSPPRISGDLSTPQRTTTIRSSQPIDLNQRHAYAIQNAIDSPQSILHASSGNVSCGTMEGLVQFLIDGFGE